MIRCDDGVLRVRLSPGEARSRLLGAFDLDEPRAFVRTGRGVLIRMRAKDAFALRHRALPNTVCYVLHGRIAEDADGARIALERRLRGGTLGVALTVIAAVGASVALFAFMLSIGRGGFTEWLGLLFLPWVLLTLAQAMHARLRLAKSEVAVLRERLASLFADVLVRSEDGPYR